MALTGLLLIVVRAALCSAVLVELGEIEEDGKRESSRSRDGRVAEYICKRTSSLCGDFCK
jgi:hypothetical protein